MMKRFVVTRTFRGKEVYHVEARDEAEAKRTVRTDEDLMPEDLRFLPPFKLTARPVRRFPR